jgi:activator of 2-hydroxyglutaryl-CoA dehydratase
MFAELAMEFERMRQNTEKSKKAAEESKRLTEEFKRSAEESRRSAEESRRLAEKATIFLKNSISHLISLGKTPEDISKTLNISVSELEVLLNG